MSVQKEEQGCRNALGEQILHDSLVLFIVAEYLEFVKSKGGKGMKWFNSTSKQLTWVFTLFFMTQIYISMYVKTVYQVDLSSFIVFTAPLEGGILGSYFYKSFKENLSKYGLNTITTNNDTTTQG